ncbi:MAG TPA: hypothetical protein VGY32_11485 [Solirubrobacteraceae bacterium]|jgi:Mn-dependent DtxR family transcriptional regulator|nr:hypothetical protein [Solirubrobacteraceae bacterium]
MSDSRMLNGRSGYKPAWSLTSMDIERMLAVFARTVAKAMVEEMRREGLVLTERKP